MAIKLGEFLHNLIKKAGQNPDAEPIKNFFLFPALADIDVPDELVTGLDNNLLSVADAKNNHPDIKKHYDRQALDTMDKTLYDYIGEDKELREVMRNERSTYQKAVLLMDKIKEQEAKKLEVNSKPDKDAIQEQKNAYQKQLNELTFELKTAQADKEKLRQEYDNRVAKIKIDSRINGMLNSYKTIYDDLDPEVRGAAINALMEKELMNNEAEFFFDERENLSIRKKDKTNFLGDNHQEIKPQAFIEQLLSKNKLLKVTTTTDQQNPGDTNNTNNANGFNALAGPPATANGQSKPQRNTVLKGLVRDVEQGLKENASRPVM